VSPKLPMYTTEMDYLGDEDICGQTNKGLNCSYDLKGWLESINNGVETFTWDANGNTCLSADVIKTNTAGLLASLTTHATCR